MIPIVVHGIMGNTYRQEVVVDAEVKGNGSLGILRDIRRQLSIQYGDDTPMTGWALQPAPAGMWLSRIERAFDANYMPAYIAVSFLIQHGRQPKSEAMLKLITDTLRANHSSYVHQSVIQSMVDWSFLVDLGADLEAYLEWTEDPTSAIQHTLNYGVVFTEEDISTLLCHIWDSRIIQCRIVYSGKSILTTDKEFVALEDIPLTETPVPVSTPTQSQNVIPEDLPEDISQDPEPEDELQEVEIPQEVSLTEEPKLGEIELKPAEKKDKGEKKKLYKILLNVLALVLILFLIWHSSHSDSSKGTETAMVQEEQVTESTNSHSDGVVEKEKTLVVKEEIDKNETQEVTEKDEVEKKAVKKGEPVDMPQEDVSMVKKYYTAHKYQKCLPLAKHYANQGNSEAQYYLANMYRRGYGVSKDTAEALKWYHKAAAQNHPIAQCTIGYFYDNGYWYEQDYCEAVKWYRKSVSQGYGIAERDLGLCYELGHCVEKDYYEAKRLYERAIAHGDADSKRLLDNVLSKIKYNL